VERTAERAASGPVEAEKAVAARSSDAVGDLSRLVAELVAEQVRANVETLQALGRARTWPEVLEARAAFGNHAGTGVGARPSRPAPPPAVPRFRPMFGRPGTSAAAT
jgi:hypothetical protein